MDRCPHCGRALRPDAEACNYCGSDFETGWNPDAEYFGFELPSDDDTYTPRERGHASGGGLVWDTVIGVGSIVLAALFFLLTVRPEALERPSTLVVVIALLIVSFWFFLVRTRGGEWEESR